MGNGLKTGQFTKDELDSLFFIKARDFHQSIVFYIMVKWTPIIKRKI